MGVSLWHKIFGSPDQQAERVAQSAGEVNAPQLDGEEARGDRGTDEVVEVNESWRRESVDVSLGEPTEADDEARQPLDENGEPRRRRRRGRGRGRGRGRRPEGEPTAEDRPGEPESLSDRPREPRGPREPSESRRRGARSDRPRREVSRKREVPKDEFDDDGLEEIVLDDDLDGDLDGDLDDDQGSDELDLGVDGEDSDDASGRSAPAGHKSIPSWDEAIGMIVDTNLATRTDRRRSSPPQSRGRSRGGRRRKKS
jgi:hypothetical protein